MRYSLGISNFLEEISSLYILLFSSIYFHCSLRKAFFSLLVFLWNSAFIWVYISFSLLLFLIFFAQLFVRLLGASVRHSTHGKGHEEGGLTYAKAGLSLRSPPGNPGASTPITRACLLYYFVLSPTPLALRGAVPHHLFRRRS